MSRAQLWFLASGVQSYPVASRGMPQEMSNLGAMASGEDQSLWSQL
jgi:hypothetical protein